MTWQIAFLLALGATAALMVAGLALVPARPALKAAVDRVDGRNDLPAPAADSEAMLDRWVERLGAWLLPRLNASKIPGLLPASPDLAITGTSMTAHLGERAVAALFGALLGPVVSAMLGFSAGTSVGAALLFAVAGWALVAANLPQKAKKERAAFTEAAVVYLELLAIARLSGAGAAQSMQDATEVADHPGLRRIGEVLNHARWTGMSAWQGLHEESLRLKLPEMGAIADITRSAGEDETEIYANLRARASTLRNARLNEIRQGAGRSRTLIAVPATGLLLVFAAGLAYPFLQGMGI